MPDKDKNEPKPDEYLKDVDPADVTSFDEDDDPLSQVGDVEEEPNNG